MEFRGTHRRHADVDLRVTPKRKVSTPAHAKHPGWHVDLGSRGSTGGGRLSSGWPAAACETVVWLMHGRSEMGTVNQPLLAASRAAGQQGSRAAS